MLTNLMNFHERLHSISNICSYHAKKPLKKVNCEAFLVAISLFTID